MEEQTQVENNNSNNNTTEAVKPKVVSHKEAEIELIIKEVGYKDTVFDNGYKEREFTEEEKVKLEDVTACLNSKPGKEQLRQLKELAQTPHGFVGGQARARAWATLLGIDYKHPISVPRELLIHALQGPWTTQVLKDTNRSLHEWVGDQDREQARRHLGSVIVKVLELGWMTASKTGTKTGTRPPDDQLPHIDGIEEDQENLRELSYFQGFHDIASTVMLTTNSEDLSVNILYNLARGALAPWFEETLAPTMDVINKIFGVVKKVDPELSSFFERSAVTPDFALSWVLTWFSHNIRDLAALQRIFDYLIARQNIDEVMLLSVAYICTCRGQLLSTKCDRDYISMFFRYDSPAIVLSAKESHLEVVLPETKKMGGCVEVDTLIAKVAELTKKMDSNSRSIATYMCVATVVLAVGVGLLLTFRK